MGVSGMIDFKVLYVPAVEPDLPQCEADRKSNYANDRHDTDRQCRWSARYHINGKLLCKKHAGIEALAMLTEMTK